MAPVQIGPRREGPRDRRHRARRRARRGRSITLNHASNYERVARDRAPDGRAHRGGQGHANGEDPRFARGERAGLTTRKGARGRRPVSKTFTSVNENDVLSAYLSTGCYLEPEKILDRSRRAIKNATTR